MPRFPGGTSSNPTQVAYRKIDASSSWRFLHTVVRVCAVLKTLIGVFVYLCVSLPPYICVFFPSLSLALSLYVSLKKDAARLVYL